MLSPCCSYLCCIVHALCHYLHVCHDAECSCSVDVAVIGARNDSIMGGSSSIQLAEKHKSLSVGFHHVRLIHSASIVTFSFTSCWHILCKSNESELAALTAEIILNCHNICSCVIGRAMHLLATVLEKESDREPWYSLFLDPFYHGLVHLILLLSP